MINEILFGLLSSGLYDVLKNGALLGLRTNLGDQLKAKLQGWVVDQTLIDEVVEQSQTLPESARQTPAALEQYLRDNQAWQNLIASIKPVSPFGDNNSGIQATSIHAEIVAGGNFVNYGSIHTGSTPEKKP